MCPLGGMVNHNPENFNNVKVLSPSENHQTLSPRWILSVLLSVTRFIDDETCNMFWCYTGCHTLLKHAPEICLTDSILFCHRTPPLIMWCRFHNSYCGISLFYATKMCILLAWGTGPSLTYKSSKCIQLKPSTLTIWLTLGEQRRDLFSKLWFIEKEHYVDFRARS